MPSDDSKSWHKPRRQRFSRLSLAFFCLYAYTCADYSQSCREVRRFEILVDLIQHSRIYGRKLFQRFDKSWSHCNV